MKKSYIVKLAIGFVAIAAIVGGCGSDNNDNTPPIPQTIQGSVIGSHYEGAWVCVDTNADGVCDDETITVTDANGSWTLDNPNNDALNVVAEIYDGAIKHSDYATPPTTTVVEKPMIFVAPLQGMVNGQLIVSPISTKVYEYMKTNGVPFETAKKAVADELGVSSDTLLTNYNIPNPSADHIALQQHSTTETGKLELGFSYHSNYIIFLYDTIQNGSYVVNDFYIHSDQDPDHHIKIGTKIDLDIYTSDYGNAGSLDFKLGRHGESDVADWWKRRVDSDQNCNNSNPDKLNFATEGTLTLAIDGKTYTFSNLFLAQGHNWSGNNWWIGGRDCHHSGNWGNPAVTCSSKNESGDTVRFKFSNVETDAFYSMSIVD